MKTKHIFSLAALALTMVACSSDDTTQSQPSLSGQKIPFSAVINTDVAGTRALTEAEDGKSITAEWKADEQVALIHGKTVEILGVESVDATSGSATIKGYLTTAPTDGEAVHVVYVGETNSVMADLKEKLEALGTDITKDNITAQASASIGSAQDGTLEAISQKLDYRYAEANFAVSEGVATFASSPKLVSQFSIWKLKLSDGTNDLKASKLVMKKGTTAHVTIDLGTSSTKSEFYMAFIPEGNSYTFEATVGESTYTCTPTISTAPASGKFYSSTLTMASATANTYRVYTSGTAYDDVAIPTDATTVTSSTTTWAAGTYVVSSDVTIASDVTLTGDVDLILSDGASLTMTGRHIYGGANYEYAGTYVLNIYGQTEGTGKLTINDSEISGNPLVVKNLSIHGGEVNVTGGEDSQGIETFGSLTIYNGTVKTSGKYNGFMVCNNDMEVYGGNITATSTNGSALSVYDGNLTIAGGSLTAKCTGQTNGCGIDVSDGTGAGTATITISGGTVVANGGTGDSGGYGIKLTGSLAVSGGAVTATSGPGGMAAISVNKITISGTADVTAIGGSNGEGILANSLGENPNYTLGEIIVNGGKLKATGSEQSYGLEGRIITVTGGEVTATGGENGAGIDGSITLGDGINLYAGTAPNPSSDPEEGPQTIDPAPDARYVIIK